MKKLSHLALAIGFAGICLTACTSYSAQDYVNDMKNLTEETLKNASTYTEEDWKRVGEEYRSINEKGKKVLENMTEDQRKEKSTGKHDRRPTERTGKILRKDVGQSCRVQS